MTRTELYKELRLQGLTYREIAQRCGVSKQAVQQVCAKSSITQFRRVTEKGCVYPVLREWMNRNYVSKAEMYRRLYGTPCVGRNSVTISDRLAGRADWKKREIDRLLKITGMTYERLFMEGEHGDSEDDLDGSGPAE